VAVIFNSEGTLYRTLAFEKEIELETAVVSLADQIFGPNTIYVDVKRRVSGNDLITIPDGYVVDMTIPDEPKLFVVENEIARHDPYKHMGIQMLRFTISFGGAERDVRNLLMQEISKDDKMLKRLEEGCDLSSSPNIDSYLDKAVYGPFRGLVIIDEAVPELHHVLEKINADISVIELQRYAAEDGREIYHFDTLYGDEDSEVGGVESTQKQSLSKDGRAARRKRRASCDTVVVPAREEGFQRVFLGENQWQAIRISPAMKEKIRYVAAYQVGSMASLG